MLLLYIFYMLVSADEIIKKQYELTLLKQLINC